MDITNERISCAQQINVPPELPEVLKDYTTTVIRMNPSAVEPDSEMTSSHKESFGSCDSTQASLLSQNSFDFSDSDDCLQDVKDTFQLRPVPANLVKHQSDFLEFMNSFAVKSNSDESVALAKVIEVYRKSGGALGRDNFCKMLRHLVDVEVIKQKEGREVFGMQMRGQEGREQDTLDRKFLMQRESHEWPLGQREKQKRTLQFSIAESQSWKESHGQACKRQAELEAAADTSSSEEEVTESAKQLVAVAGKRRRVMLPSDRFFLEVAKIGRDAAFDYAVGLAVRIGIDKEEAISHIGVLIENFQADMTKVELDALIMAVYQYKERSTR